MAFEHSVHPFPMTKSKSTYSTRQIFCFSAIDRRSDRRVLASSCSSAKFSLRIVLWSSSSKMSSSVLSAFLFRIWCNMLLNVAIPISLPICLLEKILYMFLYVIQDGMIVLPFFSVFYTSISILGCCWMIGLVSKADAFNVEFCHCIDIISCQRNW